MRRLNNDGCCRHTAHTHVTSALVGASVTQGDAQQYVNTTTSILYGLAFIYLLQIKMLITQGISSVNP